jgi:hypothetical protein
MVQPKRQLALDRAFELRNSGCPPEEIAAIVKMPRGTVYRWLGVKVVRTKKPRASPPRTQSVTALIAKHQALGDRPDPETQAKALESLAKWCLVWSDRGYKGDPTYFLDWHIKKDLEQA